MSLTKEALFYSYPSEQEQLERDARLGRGVKKGLLAATALGATYGGYKLYQHGVNSGLRTGGAQNLDIIRKNVQDGVAKQIADQTKDKAGDVLKRSISDEAAKLVPKHVSSEIERAMLERIQNFGSNLMRAAGLKRASLGEAMDKVASALDFIKQAGVPIAENIPFDFMHFESRGRGPITVHERAMTQHSSGTAPVPMAVNAVQEEAKLQASNNFQVKRNWALWSPSVNVGFIP
jgi:hypothetical protein